MNCHQQGQARRCRRRRLGRAAFRLVTLLFLLYFTADNADPLIPGVFFFESPTLFVDGVVPLKTPTMTALPSSLFPAVFDRPDETDPTAQSIGTASTRARQGPNGSRVYAKVDASKLIDGAPSSSLEDH